MMYGSAKAGLNCVFSFRGKHLDGFEMLLRQQDCCRHCFGVYSCVMEMAEYWMCGEECVK